MKNNTIDSKLLSAQVAIDNALGNVPVKSALAMFGYDETKLNEGKALYEQALTSQKQEYGEQFTATDALDSALSLANSVYMRHVKVARVALKGNRGAWQTLDLDGRRKKSYSGWVKQSKVFYTNALAGESLKATLTTYGMTDTVLTDALSKVKDVETKLAAQLKEKGDAQSATEIRDTAFDDLQDWMSDFITIARVALEGQPQLLESIGIVKA
jgi:hypothetical protein